MDRKTLAITIGKRIEAARLEAGLSRKEVGKKLGLSERGYGHLEAGRNLIGLEHLLQLPRILGKPLTHFLPIPYLTPEELNDITHDPLFADLLQAWQLLSELADMGDEAGRNAKSALRLQAQAYKNLAEERLKRKKMEE